MRGKKSELDYKKIEQTLNACESNAECAQLLCNTFKIKNQNALEMLFIDAAMLLMPAAQHKEEDSLAPLAKHTQKMLMCFERDDLNYIRIAQSISKTEKISIESACDKMDELADDLQYFLKMVRLAKISEKKGRPSNLAIDSAVEKIANFWYSNLTESFSYTHTTDKNRIPVSPAAQFVHAVLFSLLKKEFTKTYRHSVETSMRAAKKKLAA